MDRWEKLFSESGAVSSPLARPGASAGRTIVITGAGGSIGSALARTLARTDPRLLILLDQSEENLYRIETDLEGSQTPHLALCADTADAGLLAEKFEEHRPDIIYHAAAYKHIPLTESNPLACIRNNVFGTRTLAQAARTYEVPRLVMISSDKAVKPSSIMGVSKRISELLLQRYSGPGSFCAVRLGNVFGSSGSVALHFASQIARGGPVTVTHREARRYFVTLSGAVEIILAAAALGEAGVFVERAEEPFRILELAERMIAASAASLKHPVRIEFTGLRRGEKLVEEFVADDESIAPTASPLVFRAYGQRVLDSELDFAIEDLSAAIDARDLYRTLAILCRLVPGYVPAQTASERVLPALV